MADVKPTVTTDEFNYYVAYGEQITIVVPKDVAKTKADAVEYSGARYNQFKKEQRKNGKSK